MLKLKCQYFGHLMRRADSFEKTMMLGKIEGGRKRGQQRMRWLGGITNLMDMSKLQELVMDKRPGMLQPVGSQRVGYDWVTELNWTELNPYHSLASGQTTGREHSTTPEQKIRLKIYWAWLHSSEQDPNFPTASPSHQEASTILLSFSIRGQTEWKPQSQKINQTYHMDHSLD